MHRFLRRRIPGCLKSWRSAKPSFRPQLPRSRSPRRPHLVTLISFAKNDRYQVVCGTHADLTIDSADDSRLNLEVVIGDEPHAQRQLKAGERVLTRVRREKNDLQDFNIQLGVELKDVRAQLADSVKDNKRLRRGIFSKCLNELLKSSAKKAANRVMSAGMLTGRPAEEMPGSAGDLLPELSQLHEQVRQVMQGIT